MKKIAFVSVVFSLLLSFCLPLQAGTTVTVDDDKVTVDRDPRPTVVQQTPVVVVQEPAQAVLQKTEDPRELEGEIIRIDYPNSEIVVRDVDGRERRVLLKQGMINNYKVDDYVQIRLMADMREAKTINTRRTADVEGEIVSTNFTNNQIRVREHNGTERVVILRPGMANNYKAGDHVRLYVVTDYPDLAEAKIIRVK